MASSVSVNREGFTVLAEGKLPIVDIVFVHGLQGHPKETWTFKGLPAASRGADPSAQVQKTKGRAYKKLFGSSPKILSATDGTVKLQTESESDGLFWPAELLPGDVLNARILTYGYESNVTNFFRGATNQSSIYQHGKTMLSGLEACRRDFPKRPLIFIAHSLGGIVVKDVLRRSERAQFTPEFLNVYHSTFAIIFLGTPHRGASIADWANIAKRLVTAVGFDTNDQLLRSLQVNSGDLDILREEFSKMLRSDNFQIHSFQEGKGLLGVRGFNGKIVEDFSSAVDDAREVKEIINADHRDMCRFSGRKDPGYVQVYQAIDRYIRKLEENLRVEDQKLSETEAKIIKALHSPDHATFRQHMVEDPTPGTFLWFLKDHLFCSWLSRDESSFLWVRGSPGQGKTVLSKFLIGYLENGPLRAQNNAKVIYFFCYDRDDSYRTVDSILRSLIKQLLLATCNVSHHIPTTFEEDFSTTPRSDFKLWETFEAMILDRAFSTIYCVIDALDECEERTREISRSLFLQYLQSAVRKSKNVPVLKFLITSRPANDIKAELMRFPCIDLRANPDDLKIFIKSKVSTLDDFSHKLREKAMELLLERAGHTFLWVSIVVKKLKTMGLPSVTDLKNSIWEVPTDLDELYGNIVKQIMNGPLIVQKLLVWVVYAQRPLTLNELEAALATQRDSKDKRSTDDHRCELTAEAVTSESRGILELLRI